MAILPRVAKGARRRSRALFGFDQALHLTVEVGDDALRFVESVVFRLGLLFCCRGGNTPLIGQNVIAAESEKFVDAGGELLHREGIFALDQILDIIEIAGDGALKLTNLLRVQIILGDGNIRFENTAVRGVFHVVSPM